jgi:eukaryotic-like serine/threonine-protein kinase
MKPQEAVERSALAPVDRCLGKYRLLATLGRGGMADVHLAVLEGPAGFSKLLVVKELRRGPRDDDDDVSMEMFLDEARLSARLDHPNIVQTLDVGSDGERCFLAMEYLDGQPLHRVLRRARESSSPIPLQMHLRIIADVLDALEYAHTFRGFDGAPLAIVHRDVSPHNVILTYDGQVKLIDFGIAKTDLASAQTTAGIVKGKVKYMPPEQATSGAVDSRTDVFAVGIMLWEALVGHGPWHGATDVVIFRNLLSGEVPRLSDANPDLDANLIAIVNRAVSADRNGRYATASAMRADLEASMEARGTPLATLRDLPMLLSSLFDDDRRELRTLVDEQIRAPHGEQGGAHPISLTRVRTGESERTRTPSVSKPATMPKVYVSPIPPRPSAAPWKLRRSGLAIGAAGAVIVLATIIAGWRRPAAPGLTDIQSRAAASSEPASTPVMTASRVEVRALPPSARLYLDDAPVNNPYMSDMPTDGTTHRIRAEAPGYSARTRSFVAGSDGDFDIVLEREPMRPRVPPRAVTDASPRPAFGPVTGTAASVEPSPLTSSDNVPLVRKSKREVDKEDPYAR